MNSDARLFLSARRPNGQDDSDPAIAEAIQQAADDPKLAAWAESQLQQDAALAKKLRAVEPPPGLRERILAGAQLQRRGWREWFDRRAWRSFRNSEVVALAAIVLIFASALFLRTTTPADAAQSWQEAAALEVAAIEQDGSTGPLDQVVNDLPKIRAWLAEQTCPSPATLPPAVRDLPIYGCAKRSWRGQPLSIVCFAFDGGREVHLVTIEREHLPASPPEKAPVFAEVRGYQTACWSEGTVAMMLLGKVERRELETLFESVTAARKPSEFLVAVRHHSAPR